VTIGKRNITLRRASPRHLVAASTPAGTFVQALRYLGKDAESDLDAAAHQLSPQDRRRLMQEKAFAPGWMRPLIDRMVRTGS